MRKGILELNDDDVIFLLHIHQALTKIFGADTTQILMSSRFYRMFSYSPDDTRQKTVSYWVEHIIREFYIKSDNEFPDGVLAIPRSPNEPRVKVRALLDYCRERGITPSQLSEEEMEKFLQRSE